MKIAVNASTTSAGAPCPVSVAANSSWVTRLKSIFRPVAPAISPFLTSRRLALAADLLREPEAGLAAVARRVGYSSPFALSTAFERVRGVSPREYRERAVAG